MIILYVNRVTWLFYILAVSQMRVDYLKYKKFIYLNNEEL